MTALIPSKLNLHKASGQLEISYADSESYLLSFEFLRVNSPSAEVRGHGEGTEVLQHGKKNVTVNKIEPVGNYAIKLVFSDGHQSGIYSWDYLRELCENRDKYWSQYLAKLKAAHLGRD
jgi:DUF971 family protein